MICALALSLTLLNSAAAAAKLRTPLPLPGVVCHVPARFGGHKAAYQDGTIYLSDKANAHIILHELIHYYQDMYGESFACPETIETDALRMQYKWCRSHGCPVHDEAFIMERGCEI